MIRPQINVEIHFKYMLTAFYFIIHRKNINRSKYTVKYTFCWPVSFFVVFHRYPVEKTKQNVTKPSLSVGKNEVPLKDLRHLFCRRKEKH